MEAHYISAREAAADLVRAFDAVDTSTIEGCDALSRALDDMRARIAPTVRLIASDRDDADERRWDIIEQLRVASGNPDWTPRRECVSTETLQRILAELNEAAS